jgi:hypothetical protein
MPNNVESTNSFERTFLLILLMLGVSNVVNTNIHDSFSSDTTKCVKRAGTACQWVGIESEFAVTVMKAANACSVAYASNDAATEMSSGQLIFISNDSWRCKSINAINGHQIEASMSDGVLTFSARSMDGGAKPFSIPTYPNFGILGRLKHFARALNLLPGKLSDW